MNTDKEQLLDYNRRFVNKENSVSNEIPTEKDLEKQNSLMQETQQKINEKETSLTTIIEKKLNEKDTFNTTEILQKEIDGKTITLAMEQKEILQAKDAFLIELNAQRDEKITTEEFDIISKEIYKQNQMSDGTIDISNYDKQVQTAMEMITGNNPKQDLIVSLGLDSALFRKDGSSIDLKEDKIIKTDLSEENLKDDKILKMSFISKTIEDPLKNKNNSYIQQIVDVKIPKTDSTFDTDLSGTVAKETSGLIDLVNVDIPKTDSTFDTDLSGTVIKETSGLIDLVNIDIPKTNYPDTIAETKQDSDLTFNILDKKQDLPTSNLPDEVGGNGGKFDSPNTLDVDLIIPEALKDEAKALEADIKNMVDHDASKEEILAYLSKPSSVQVLSEIKNKINYMSFSGDLVEKTNNKPDSVTVDTISDIQNIQDLLFMANRIDAIVKGFIEAGDIVGLAAYKASDNYTVHIKAIASKLKTAHTSIDLVNDNILKTNSPNDIDLVKQNKALKYVDGMTFDNIKDLATLPWFQALAASVNKLKISTKEKPLSVDSKDMIDAIILMLQTPGSGKYALENVIELLPKNISKYDLTSYDFDGEASLDVEINRLIDSGASQQTVSDYVSKRREQIKKFKEAEQMAVKNTVQQQVGSLNKDPQTKDAIKYVQPIINILAPFASSLIPIPLPINLNEVFNATNYQSKVDVELFLSRAIPFAIKDIQQVGLDAATVTDGVSALNFVSKIMKLKGVENFKLNMTPIELVQYYSYSVLTNQFSKNFSVKTWYPYNTKNFVGNPLQNNPDIDTRFNIEQAHFINQRQKFVENVFTCGKIVVYKPWVKGGETQYDKYQIPFQFTPVIGAQSIATDWKSKQLFNRIGGIYYFSGVGNMQLNIDLEFNALSGMTTEQLGFLKSDPYFNPFSVLTTFVEAAMSKAQKAFSDFMSFDLWNSSNNQKSFLYDYWNQGVVDTTMYAIRGLQYPLMGQDYLLPPPIIEIDFGPMSNILKKPVVSPDKFASKLKFASNLTNKTFIVSNISIEQDLKDKAIMGYRTPTFSEIQADKIINASEQANLKGFKGTSFSANLKKDADASLNNNDDAGSIFTQYFKASLTLIEVETNIFDLPGSFADYYTKQSVKDLKNTSNMHIINDSFTDSVEILKNRFKNFDKKTTAALNVAKQKSIDTAKKVYDTAFTNLITITKTAYSAADFIVNPPTGTSIYIPISAPFPQFQPGWANTYLSDLIALEGYGEILGFEVQFEAISKNVLNGLYTQGKPLESAAIAIINGVTILIPVSVLTVKAALLVWQNLQV